MNINEARELVHLLSQAINISDKLGLSYGDDLLEMIQEINDKFELDD